MKKIVSHSKHPELFYYMKKVLTWKILMILILLVIPFHAAAVFTLGYDSLFKSILGHSDPA